MSYNITFGREKYHLHREMIEWCRDHIGAGGYTNDANPVWDLSIAFGHSTYYFKHAKDLEFFMLRWS